MTLVGTGLGGSADARFLTKLELSSQFPDGVDVSKLTDMHKQATENARRELAARQLFLVEQHDMGKRKLYCGYASDPRRPKNFTRYAMQVWADDTPRIIGTYFVCGTCDGLGTADGPQCSDCGGGGWLHKTGERVKSDKPTAVKKLVRPNWPRSAEHYDQR